MRAFFIFRAYYSMPPDMADAEGNATHALYGFARFLSDLLEQVRPERICVAFDQSLRSETSFRNGIYPRYKANREAPPADLERQFALCREFCRHLGLASFASPEYEADDIIGTLATRARSAGLRNVVVTRDKDLSQLIRDGDVFWDYSANARYHYHDIGPRFGANPELMADFLALTGDSVDNIPGSPRDRPEDRRRPVRDIRIARRAVCKSRARSLPEAARRGARWPRDCSPTRRRRTWPGGSPASSATCRSSARWMNCGRGRPMPPASRPSSTRTASGPSCVDRRAASRDFTLRFRPKLKPGWRRQRNRTAICGY